ncbi:ABC transporter ATP-binding protein [Pseudobacter ginsenosidimutans]|jgi:ABC-2 type transport system ATP-binding protein|uniref:ABC-2 type transport system ATP-binding protein n=1 Tax=Pseudobacter ginsenosidimutans TaxID=661488 RepID=A0A4Q7MVG7_9BACT|nr:ATP-binding cassette domain-containing protein [Pseudobacter ginsenosidimutans]RZS72608.1 ABC-2 type transport system ATP-binding protein [Pseudobacter ginsenosidimutans]
MQQTIVKLENLSHRYSQQWAVKDISFEINRNGILGLLGSNGAGKSTTMNILCGVLSQTEGQVSIDGIDIRQNPEEAKKRIGFLPQQAPLHLEQTVDEYLTFCAHIRLLPKRDIKAAVEAVKERCGVAHFSNRLIGNLSGGYRQRVGIAQAIIHKPLLVVLDEPTNGLDPNQILEVRQLIKEIAAERSVIFSSHILAEVQATCHDIIMIEGGQVVFKDTMQAFNNYIAPDSLIVSFENAPSIEVLKSIPGITSGEQVEDKTYRLHFDDAHQISEKVVLKSVEEGWRLTEINLEKSSLDAIFAQLSNKRSSQTIS